MLRLDVKKSDSLSLSTAYQATDTWLQFAPGDEIDVFAFAIPPEPGSIVALGCPKSSSCEPRLSLQQIMYGGNAPLHQIPPLEVVPGSGRLDSWERLHLYQFGPEELLSNIIALSPTYD